MNIRQPIQAGGFYEASALSCRRHAGNLLEAANLPGALPQQLYGGIVPHAGWSYSGALAAMAFKALAAARPLETVVLLGADHRGTVRRGEVYDSGVWRTPLGDVAVDEQVAAALLAGAGELLRANPQAHASEHSLEVQVPFLQILSEQVKIVPIGVPPAPAAAEIGRAVGKVLAEQFPGLPVIASTDLTHHGGHFPAPGGHGEKGVRWAEDNDRRMIQLVETMAAEHVIPEYEQRGNACGAGAIAAAIAACQAMGATRGILLAYTNSYRIIHEKYPYELDETTVGYAAMVFA